jgi:hypothetical protein
MRTSWIAAFAVSVAPMPSAAVASGVETLPHVVSIVHMAPALTDGSTPTLTWRDPPLDGRVDGVVRRNRPASARASGREPDRVLSHSVCDQFPRALHGQVAPETDGGRLQIHAGVSTTLNRSGRIAFGAVVTGSFRNQGVFVSDADGIRTIVIGCGGGGGSGQPGSGCGDPSPIGGTFSGLFLGTPYTPAINDAGDVLFLCEVDGGTSQRGLFLYRAATDDITKVAAIGDPSPLGGVFDRIGPGSLNDDGTVVFLASPPGDGLTRADAFRWQDGVVTKIAAVGDPAPGGGFFSHIGTEAFGYIDGTYIPSGPVPDINDANQICFNAYVAGGITTAGVIVRTGAVDQWYVKAPDPTPAGGTYIGMWAAAINDGGEIAFFADYYATPNEPSSGWFAGRPGHWWKVIAFFDAIDGGQSLGLAVSRNPLQAIDEDGNVLFWTGIGPLEDEMGRLVVASADGERLVVARDDDPAPGGGVYTSLNPWPSMSNGRGTNNASTSIAAALMTFELCTTVAVTLQDFGSRWAAHGVEVYWQLAGIESELACDVYRDDVPGGAYERIETPVIRRSGLDFVFEDRSAEAGRTYRYRVVILEDGEPVTSFETEIATPRAAFVLHPNVPNPFNPMTRIDFALDASARAALAIYDVRGQQIRTLVQGSLPAGPHSVRWDGRDDRGRVVASGIYTVQLTADGRVRRQKAVLLK